MSPLTRIHISIVTAVGCAAALAIFWRAGPPPGFGIEWSDRAFWVLAGLAILGELVPFRVPFRHEAQEVTLSTTFVLAILFMFGLPAAIAIQAAGSLVSDTVHRKPWWKAAFNVGQYTVSWTAAAFTVGLVGSAGLAEITSFDPERLAAVVIAGTAFFLVNNTIIGVVIASATGSPVAKYLRRDFLFHASTALVLSSLAPVVIVLATKHAWLVPLLLLPIGAVHKSARISLTMEHQAHHDGLTGLPNRLAFHEWVDDVLTQEAGVRLDVMVLDLDAFKDVNDTLGHEIGDRLLRLVADRLAHEFSDGLVIVTRLGADEFAIAAQRTNTQLLLSGINAAFERPFSLAPLALPMTASVGAARHPEDGATAAMLIQRAEVAMHLAKARQTSFERYHSDEDVHTTRRLSILAELHNAIERDELVFHYQPVVDIASRTVTSVETLVRWQHPRHGLVGPDEFIPLAEPTGLIQPLTAYALETALRQCRAWLDDGRRIAVAVNVSVRNLYEESFAANVRRLLTLCRVPATMLTLEITEGTVMADPVRVAAALGELHVMGVKISIDDFGTGYSSLVHLRRLPVDAIKIDRSFVMNMDHDENDAAIVRTTIDLAHSLGLRVVAEGVEVEAHLAQLEKLKCDYAQGYLLGRPAPAADLVLDAPQHPLAPADR
jgi:diguanylate cyclase (GGDEF)-like protein